MYTTLTPCHDLSEMVDFSYMGESAKAEEFKEEIIASLNIDEHAPIITFGFDDSGGPELSLSLGFLGDCWFKCSLEDIAESYSPIRGASPSEARDVSAMLRSLADRIDCEGG